jgi:glycosyltransferase involved in cell wall biosynthesis
MTPLKVAYDPLTRRRFLRDAHNGYALAFAMYRSVDRRTWRHYQRVFCVSEEVRRRLIDARLVEAARLEVLRPGVDTEAFSPAGEREPFFLVAGRIMWQKNIELALDAWRHFKRSAQGRIFRLVVAGMVDGKSESYLRHLRGLASDLSDVEFVVRPSDEELISLYRRCHAVLFTAPNEDFGLVPLEAMACGKPVVAIGRGGPRETVVPDETGIFARGDIASFAEAIGVIAEIPPRDYARISQATRQRALEFSWDSFAHRLDEHVETLGVGPARPTLVRR